MQDALLCQRRGGHPVLACREGSELYRKAEAMGIQTERLFRGKEPPRQKRRDLFRVLRGVLRREKINVVHCCDLTCLWIVALILRDRHWVSLFFSIQRGLDDYHFSFFKKWLLRRVDHFLLPHDVASENVLSHLPLERRKLFVLGMRVSTTFFCKRELGETIKIGMPINGNEEDFQELVQALRGVHLFSLKHKRSVHLALYAPFLWKDYRVYRELNFVLEELGMTEWTHLVDAFSLENAFDSDLVLTPFSDRLFSDWALKALLEGIPLLAPRISESQAFLDVTGDVIETYRRGDLRDISNGILALVKTHRERTEQLYRRHRDLEDKFGPQAYEGRLWDLYGRSFEKRRRFGLLMKASSRGESRSSRGEGRSK